MYSASNAYTYTHPQNLCHQKVIQSGQIKRQIKTPFVNGNLSHLFMCDKNVINGVKKAWGSFSLTLSKL